MRRVVHDLGGFAQRYSRIAEQLDQEIEKTQEIWRDQRGQAFLRERLHPFKPTVSQLVAGLSETQELFESLVKRLSDPEMLR